jgi:glutamate 5-kinase
VRPGSHHGVQRRHRRRHEAPGLAKRPHEINELQAAAAVGQMGLAQMYETKLREQGLGSAQVLLTHADLADRERYLNARSTLLTLLQYWVLPVINENDTVVNDEIKVGDNDTWARWWPIWSRPICWSS